MRVEMVEALRALGVDNLQVFPVRLDSKGCEAPGYVAVNIVGRFDPEALPDDAPLVFRNRRGAYQILVHERVRQALSDFEDLEFLKLSTAPPL